ncbi:transcriptional regulator [Pseudoduganella eburnea]|uniref:Transcriptional regulator n=1 Tax=Massilia eburnea TaxID=1776165 RepID=A0A6L6Q9G7_9BURK|nr:transcriptional regulator [Massilia eburnea]MTW09022.1 transcriptional regulator [Massilia eburnea]
MQLIEPGEKAEFDAILRRHHLAQSDFSLSAIDTTDPKTDELSGLQGELTVTRRSTGQTKQYFISDSTSWLDLFRHDIADRVFLGRQNGGT